MAERLNGVLARWVRCPDKALRQHLFNLGEPNDDQMIARARPLFARVLEAPGGLRSSEARRVGKEDGSTCRSRRSPSHENNNTLNAFAHFGAFSYTTI